MKTSDTADFRQTMDEPIRLIDKLARRAVLSKLQNIQQGRIQIIDQGRIYQFGNARDCSLKACITVRNPGFYSSVAFAGSVGAGEAYFQGDWDCDNLTSLVRLLLVNREVLDRMDGGLGKLMLPVNRMLHWINRNTRKGSQRNIAAHYDLGNDLFEVMLDETMMYSSAIYDEHNTRLEQAAVNKLDRICKKLELTENDHVLEIGSGWGGFAIHAANNYGCRVTTTTISEQQYKLAHERIRQAGLQDKITLLKKDYRDLEGRFDKMVSIEMIEAIGQENLHQYFRQCSKLLKEDGMFLLQAITIADQRYQQALREVDYIQKYIFPGGSLPSVTAMADAITGNTNMRMTHLEDIGPHYAQTLRHWRERFFQHESHIRELGYNERFIRLWEFYLCYCEGGFEERAIGTVQMLLSKPSCRRDAIVPQLD